MAASTPNLLDSSVVDMRLEPVKPAELDAVSVFERLARDPSVDVDKLDRLMQMHERVTAKQSEGAFNGAMSDAQADMRPIAADALNPQTRSKYATYAALDSKLRPIYTRHGFGMSFDTGDSPMSPMADYVRVLCHVTHRGGYMRTYHVDMPADGKGAKGGDVMTKTHAVGAAMSYGMRYLLKMIFNVAVGEDDRDGNDPATQPAAPDGFDDWLADLTAVADDGLTALQAAWKQSRKAYCEHLTKASPGTWNSLKTKAAKVRA
jgi:hypothetical protein